MLGLGETRWGDECLGERGGGEGEGRGGLDGAKRGDFFYSLVSLYVCAHVFYSLNRSLWLIAYKAYMNPDLEEL